MEAEHSFLIKRNVLIVYTTSCADAIYPSLKYIAEDQWNNKIVTLSMKLRFLLMTGHY